MITFCISGLWHVTPQYQSERPTWLWSEVVSRLRDRVSMSETIATSRLWWNSSWIQGQPDVSRVARRSHCDPGFTDGGCRATFPEYHISWGRIQSKAGFIQSLSWWERSKDTLVILVTTDFFKKLIYFKIFMDFYSTTLMAKQYGQLVLSTYFVWRGTGRDSTVISPTQRPKNKILWSLHPMGLEDHRCTSL